MTAHNRCYDKQRLPGAGPHRLLANIVVGAHEQANEDRDGTLLDHHAGVVTRAAGDVGQRPGRLELEGRVVVALQELDELGHHARVNNVLDRRVTLCKKKGREGAQGESIDGVASRWADFLHTDAGDRPLLLVQHWTRIAGFE